MKIWITAILAVLLGASLGVGSSYWQLTRGESYGFSKEGTGLTVVDRTGGSVGSSGNGESVHSDKRARLEVVDGADFDFGIMAKEEHRSHTFVIKNVGDAPSHISFLRKTCQCTEPEPLNTYVEPGDSTEITLTWSPNNYNPEFSQGVTFKTEDPGQLELTLSVSGRVQQLASVKPIAVDFGTVGANRDAVRDIEVFGYLDGSLQIVDVELLTEATADHFEVTVNKMESDRVDAEPGAVCGWIVALKAKAGLPVGGFGQHVRITTNRHELGPFEIPVKGVVAGEVSVVGGSAFNRDENLLDLGVLNGANVTKENLLILFKGEHAANAMVEVSDIDPAENVSVSIGDAVKKGNIARFPLKLEFKPNGRVVNRRGSSQGKLGRIVLKTNHPDAQEVIVYLSFAIEGNSQ